MDVGRTRQDFRNRARGRGESQGDRLEVDIFYPGTSDRARVPVRASMSYVGQAGQ